MEQSVFDRVADRVRKEAVLPLQWTLVYADALEAQVQDLIDRPAEPSPIDVLRVQEVLSTLDMMFRLARRVSDADRAGDLADAIEQISGRHPEAREARNHVAHWEERLVDPRYAVSAGLGNGVSYNDGRLLDAHVSILGTRFDLLAIRDAARSVRSAFDSILSRRPPVVA